MNAREVNQRLADCAESVCLHLLSNGKRYGNQWKVGDIHNSPPSDAGKGGSLVVDIAGPTVGRFKDFAGGDETHGATFLDLWMQARNMDFKEALKDAAQWLGVDLDTEPRRVTPSGTRQRQTKKPVPTSGDLENMLKPVVEGSAVWKWLTEERNISPEAIRAYKLGESTFKHKSTDEEWTCLIFPFYDETGKLVQLKGRDIYDKGKMYFYPKKSEGGKLLLFGLQAVTNKNGTLHITEGELDALSAYDYGFEAVSVPNGAQAITQDGRNPNTEWLENSYDWLQQFSTIYLSLDEDEHGAAAVKAIAPRIGLERVRVTEYPSEFKDFNECQKNNVEGEVIEVYLEEAKDFDPEALAKPSDYRKAIWEEFFPPDGEEPGDPTPWTLPFRFRLQEVTVFHGYNGSGKTVCMTYMHTHLAGLLHRRTCIASLEMAPQKTLKNIMRMGIAKHRPADEKEFSTALDFMDQYFYLFDHVGEASIDEIMEVWKYAARKYGVQYFVLDSLMCCDISEDDYQGQKNFVNLLTGFAREYNAHVSVVCHDRKPDSRHPEDTHPPQKNQINGSSKLTDRVHNVICVFRNRSKEKDLQDAEYLEIPQVVQKLHKLGVGDSQIDKGYERQTLIRMLEQECDTQLIIQKQRETGVEMYKHLWFDTADEGKSGSWQYFENPEEQAVPLFKQSMSDKSK